MAPDMRSHRATCSCFPKKVFLQLSSEQFVGNVWIARLDRKTVPQARSRDCKSSFTIKTEWTDHNTPHWWSVYSLPTWPNDDDGNDDV